MAQGFIPSASFALSGAFPYLEYGWVCASNTAAQTITGGTITTLTLDTEIQDLGLYGTISGNQVTLQAGTYYAMFYAPICCTDGATTSGVLALYNTTDSSYTLRGSLSGSAVGTTPSYVVGQFTITGTKVFDLRINIVSQASSVTISHRNGTYGTPLTSAVAGSDQRATLKLWKIA